MDLSGLGKAGAIVFVLVAALELWGKWTGSTGSVDFLGMNQLGARMTQSLQASGNTSTSAGGTWGAVSSAILGGPAAAAGAGTVAGVNAALNPFAGISKTSAWTSGFPAGGGALQPVAMGLGQTLV